MRANGPVRTRSARGPNRYDVVDGQPATGVN